MELRKTHAFIIAAFSLIAVEAQRCPIGKFRDPVTGQCTGPNAGPVSGGRCPIGQFRDPVTGDCKGPNVFGQGVYASGQNYPGSGQQCTPGTVFNPRLGRCATYQDWFCDLCNECCYGGARRYQQIHKCYFDASNFDGCLGRHGFTVPTISNLVSVSSSPVFLPALYAVL